MTAANSYVWKKRMDLKTAAMCEDKAVEHNGIIS